MSTLIGYFVGLFISLVVIIVVLLIYNYFQNLIWDHRAEEVAKTLLAGSTVEHNKLVNLRNAGRITLVTDSRHQILGYSLECRQDPEKRKIVIAFDPDLKTAIK